MAIKKKIEQPQLTQTPKDLRIEKGGSLTTAPIKPPVSTGTGLFQTTAAGIKTEKTPEQVAQEKQGGADFIHAREALTMSLMEQGHTAVGAERIAQVQLANQEQMKAGELPTQLPFQSPEMLGKDTKPEGLGALDTGKIVGGAVAGAGTGAAIGAVGGPVGALIGGVIGGVGGAATAFFYSSSSERKQQTKVSFNNFKDATTQMDNIIKDVNTQHYSKQQARANWDNEYQRILKSERELKLQQRALFGEKLSRSLDELSKIESWKRRYAQFNFDFEMALANPDPSRVINSVADTTPDTEIGT